MWHTDWFGELPIKVLRSCCNQICPLSSLEARSDLVEGKITFRRTSFGLLLKSALRAVHACQKLNIVKGRGRYALTAEKVHLIGATGLVNTRVPWLVRMVGATDGRGELEHNSSTDAISVMHFLQNRCKISTERS